MADGGTNGDHLGFPEGYTRGDYGAVIAEDRTTSREKYSQAKLQANFRQVSPGYLAASPHSNHRANGSYTDTDAIATTALIGRSGGVFVVRHAAHNSKATTNFRIVLPTSEGNLTLPQLDVQATWSLVGRDSKILVTDDDLAGLNLLYSTAETFTWKRYGAKRALAVYTGSEGINELAIMGHGEAKITEGGRVLVNHEQGYTVLQFSSSPARRIVEFECGPRLVIVDRSDAYHYQTLSNE